MRALFTTVGLMAAFALGAGAAIQTGPEVGTRMPGFQAPDQFGKTRSLSSLLGAKGLVLVIFRSADW